MKIILCICFSLEQKILFGRMKTRLSVLLLLACLLAIAGAQVYWPKCILRSDLINLTEYLNDWNETYPPKIFTNFNITNTTCKFVEHEDPYLWILTISDFEIYFNYSKRFKNITRSTDYEDMMLQMVKEFVLLETADDFNKFLCQTLWKTGNTYLSGKSDFLTNLINTQIMKSICEAITSTLGRTSSDRLETYNLHNFTDQRNLVLDMMRVSMIPSERDNFNLTAWQAKNTNYVSMLATSNLVLFSYATVYAGIKLYRGEVPSLKAAYLEEAKTNINIQRLETANAENPIAGLLKTMFWTVPIGLSSLTYNYLTSENVENVVIGPALNESLELYEFDSYNGSTLDIFFLFTWNNYRPSLCPWSYLVGQNIYDTNKFGCVLSRILGVLGGIRHQKIIYFVAPNWYERPDMATGKIGLLHVVDPKNFPTTSFATYISWPPAFQDSDFNYVYGGMCPVFMTAKQYFDSALFPLKALLSGILQPYTCQELGGHGLMSTLVAIAVFNTSSCTVRGSFPKFQEWCHLHVFIGFVPVEGIFIAIVVLLTYGFFSFYRIELKLFATGVKIDNQALLNMQTTMKKTQEEYNADLKEMAEYDYVQTTKAKKERSKKQTKKPMGPKEQARRTQRLKEDQQDLELLNQNNQPSDSFEIKIE